jgi:hypothetical protein
MDLEGVEEKGKMSKIKAIVARLVFLENLIEDFPLWMDWPDQR